MPEMGTSGSMSGEGKQSRILAAAALLLDSTEYGSTGGGKEYHSEVTEIMHKGHGEIREYSPCTLWSSGWKIPFINDSVSSV